MKTVLKVMLIVLLAVGLCGVIVQISDYIRSDMAKNDAIVIASTPPEVTVENTTLFTVDTAEETVTKAELAEETVEEPAEIDAFAETLLDIDISALQAKNDEVIGWIIIPNSTVNYPLLQGEDNTHYLDYAWDNSRNAGGSIYLDYRSNSDFTDFHSIIYGHRMYRDAMFNSLKHYSDIEYLKSHPSVYIVTENAVMRYDAFAAYDADAINGHSYRLGLKDVSGKQAYINYCIRNSVIDSGIIPSAENGDRVLTLSTCSESGSEETRWVVHFVHRYE